MFTAKPQKHRAAATTYFDEHLSHNDYYAQNEAQIGHWIGQGAEQLGLMPGEVVTRDAFLKLCDNVHPVTGKHLTPEQRRDRPSLRGRQSQQGLATKNRLPRLAESVPATREASADSSDELLLPIPRSAY